MEGDKGLPACTVLDAAKVEWVQRGDLVFLIFTRALLLIVDLGQVKTWELLRSADGSGPT